MKINLLTKNFSDEVILYSPELELSESPNVAEKCFPAIGMLKNQPENNRIFFLLNSEIGEYDDFKKHPQKGIYYEALGGKEEIEKILNNKYKQF